jgi:hypothetical protein
MENFSSACDSLPNFARQFVELCRSILISRMDFTSSCPIDNINSAFKLTDITVFVRNVLTRAKVEKQFSDSGR